ncbi:MAG TPA: acetolactate decarboxylase [Candidatus Binatia bacterium]|jgi:acetolactate decarboxylase|nr:acetolactate decarboxylase [Candidatus Binatia bacterium]
MHALQVRLSPSLWDALHERHRATGEPLGHIIRAALAQHLGHDTLFQVSTSTALVEGVYRGAMTVGALLEHGDFGLGTFEGIDGEMVVLDGRCFQVRDDGTVRAAADTAPTPFAVVTRFRAEHTASVPSVDDLAGLLAHVDAMRTSDNVFYAVRVEGTFPHVHTRAMCRTADGVPLAEAAAHQPEFQLRDVEGTCVGFWSPDYARTFEVPGHHLHFLTRDASAGGHVLGLSGRDLRVQVQTLHDFRVALPEHDAFLHADLTHDPASALARAEHDTK